MKYIIGVLFLFTVISCKSKIIPTKEKVNVLFVGNSLTYYHDMPKMLQSMLDETSEEFNIEQSTFPGLTLAGHLEKIILEQNDGSIHTREKKEDELTETEKKLAEKNWDIIILQENTGNMYFKDVVTEIVNPAIKGIRDRVANRNCRFIIFSTWPSKEKYPKIEVSVPKYYFNRKKFYINEQVSNEEKFHSRASLNIEEDFMVLNNAFSLVAKKNNMEISNHGNLYYKIIKEFPQINLYDDEYHPSEEGSFLNACEFYKMLTVMKPSKLKFKGRLDIKKAKILKKIAS